MAAGEGKRMRPLTNNTPKPLLRIAGKTILDYIFSALPEEIDEVIIVVRYLGDQIKNYCGSQFYGRRVIYVEGSNLGTAYSFLAAAPHLTNERFLLIYGDEMPKTSDIKACLLHKLSIVCWHVDDPSNHGIARLRDDGTIAEIIEKPKHPSGNMIADGVMVLNSNIFKYQPEKNANGEFYLSSLLNQFVKQERVMAVVSTKPISGISTPADLERVEKILTN